MPFPATFIGVPKEYQKLVGARDLQTPQLCTATLYPGGVIASVASFDLVKIASILVLSAARYHIFKMFTSPKLRIANGNRHP